MFCSRYCRCCSYATCAESGIQVAVHHRIMRQCTRNINVYILVLRLLLKTFTARARKMYNFYSNIFIYFPSLAASASSTKYMLCECECVCGVWGKFKFICVALKWAEDATRMPKNLLLWHLSKSETLHY